MGRYQFRKRSNFDSTLYSHSPYRHSHGQKRDIWTLSHLNPFDELLISWNALRPSCGHYVILSRVLIRNQWSPWLLYAVWGFQEQFSFHDTTTLAPVRSFQDQIELLEGEFATGLGIRIEACSGATLENFYHVYVCTSRLKFSRPFWSPPLHVSFSLSVPKISQLSLTHPRARSFCSPTSTTAVIQYLLSHSEPTPLHFAQRVYDAGFDIYGNWSFNIAQAFVELGVQWQCFCVRMTKIEWLWHSLKRGLPVVISVKGILPGTFLPYSSGHLMVITGYHAATQEFLCMDPAFPSNEETEKTYPWEVFMQAWENRHYLAYFFLPREK